MSMFLKKSATQALKDEFKEARDELTGANLITAEGFQQIAIAEFPEYNCPEGFKKIRKVWYGYTADLYLTRTIEKVRTNLLPPNENIIH